MVEPSLFINSMNDLNFWTKNTISKFLAKTKLKVAQCRGHLVQIERRLQICRMGI